MGIVSLGTLGVSKETMTAQICQELIEMQELLCQWMAMVDVTIVIILGSDRNYCGRGSNNKPMGAVNAGALGASKKTRTVSMNPSGIH